MFTEDPLVLWLKPDDRGMLKQLRKVLEETLPQAIPELPFTYQPHVSIGFFQDLESLRMAYEQAQRELTPIEFQVDEISYIVQESDILWHVFDRIRLNDRNQHDESH